MHSFSNLHKDVCMEIHKDKDSIQFFRKWKKSNHFWKLKQHIKTVSICKWFNKHTTAVVNQKNICSRDLNYNILLGFPGGAVVENLPANAGDMGSSPGLGRSHMPRSNWAREPQLLSLHVWSLCSATRGRDSERPAYREKSDPRSPQLEKALAQQRRPNTAKKIN